MVDLSIEGPAILQNAVNPTRIALLCAAALVVLLTAACGPLTRKVAVPAKLQDRAIVPGVADIRYWGDDVSPVFARDLLDSFNREMTVRRNAGQQGPLPPVNFLAISGGGENGAYGAGLLVGWTAAGTRPNFKLVTGISTGALTAPFAFLGPDYDAQLREVYTTLSGKDVLSTRGVFAAILDDAMADNAPLRQTMSRYVNQAMLDAIAAEHRKGRVLLVGTTDLDARRPVIWNITKLADSGHPKALELFQNILIASAAIPGAFPPVMIDVEVDGKPYQEMHVDGGASSQVFLYPPELELGQASRDLNIVRDRHVYILRNARLDPEWAEVERQTFSIAQRAISSLIQTQGVGDLYRIYAAAQRDGLDFNLTYIPASFETPLKTPFETAYMKELFEVGYKFGTSGQKWHKVPPDFQAIRATPTAGAAPK
jgi:predicted acylesterase/phospholipase RssA